MASRSIHLPLQFGEYVFDGANCAYLVSLVQRDHDLDAILFLADDLPFLFEVVIDADEVIKEAAVRRRSCVPLTLGEGNSHGESPASPRASWIKARANGDSGTR